MEAPREPTSVLRRHRDEARAFEERRTPESVAAALQTGVRDPSGRDHGFHQFAVVDGRWFARSAEARDLLAGAASRDALAGTFIDRMAEQRSSLSLGEGVGLGLLEEMQGRARDPAEDAWRNARDRGLIGAHHGGLFFGDSVRVGDALGWFDLLDGLEIGHHDEEPEDS